MKRFLSLCLIAVLLLSMAGCKNAANGAGDEQAVVDEIFETEEVSKKEEQSVEGKEPVEIPPVEQEPEEPESPAPPATETPMIEMSSVIPASTHDFSTRGVATDCSAGFDIDNYVFVVIRSVEELKTYYENNKYALDLEKFSQHSQKYDEAYFEKQCLILIRLFHGGGLDSYRVVGLHRTDAQLEISILNSAPYGFDGAAVVSWSYVFLEPEVSLSIPEDLPIKLQFYKGVYDYDHPEKFYYIEPSEKSVTEQDPLVSPYQTKNHVFSYRAVNTVGRSDIDLSIARVFRSQSELDEFCRISVDWFQSTSQEKYSGILKEALARYDHAYFAKQCLILVFVAGRNTEYQVTDLTLMDNEHLLISVLCKGEDPFASTLTQNMLLIEPESGSRIPHPIAISLALTDEFGKEVLSR